MNITIEFDPKDKNGTPLSIGDVVEVAPEGARKTIKSFDIYAYINYCTGDAQDNLPDGSFDTSVRYINFEGGGFADPRDCVKVEQTVAERIEAVLNDTDLTDGEVLDEILRIIGHKRKV